MPADHARQVGLELRDIRKCYGSVRAIESVSLAIRPGEFVALLGPSGSGKTTTLMAIAGFVRPDSGQILLGGSDITFLPPHRRNLGMVYQNYALFPHLTVERNIAFPLEMRGVPRTEIRTRVADALALVQLVGAGERLPRQLSGGQQQRVALARALVFEPPVLLMDEPLGALDRKLREEMQLEIIRIQRRLGITTVYVTHDQEEALTMSDRVVVMRDGRIEQSARPPELYDHPATQFVAEFIGAANLVPVTVQRDGGLLSSGGLLFSADGSGACQVGDAAFAVIRPERVRLRYDGQGFDGTVESASFAGGVWRYQVELQGGDRLKVSESNMGAPPATVGEQVTVQWRPEDVWLIARSH